MCSAEKLDFLGQKPLPAKIEIFIADSLDQKRFAFPCRCRLRDLRGSSFLIPGYQFFAFSENGGKGYKVLPTYLPATESFQ
jgi:hypothetical protein